MTSDMEVGEGAEAQRTGKPTSRVIAWKRSNARGTKCRTAGLNAAKLVSGSLIKGGKSNGNKVLCYMYSFGYFSGN